MTLKKFFWSTMGFLIILILLLQLAFYFVEYEVLKESACKNIGRSLERAADYLEKVQYVLLPFVASETKVYKPENLKIGKDQEIFSKPNENFSMVYIREKDGRYKVFKVYYKDFFEYFQDVIKGFKVSETKSPDKVGVKVNVYGKDFYLIYPQELAFDITKTLMFFQFILILLVIFLIISYFYRKLERSIFVPIIQLESFLKTSKLSDDLYIPKIGDVFEEFEDLRNVLNSFFKLYSDKLVNCEKRRELLKSAAKVIGRYLKEYTKILDEVDSLESRLKQVLNAAIETLPSADAGSIYLRKDRWSYFVTSVGFDERYLKGLVLPAYVSKRPTIVDWKTSDFALRLPEDVKDRFIKSGGGSISISLFVPIFKGNKIIGELWLDSFRKNSFEEYEIYAAEFFAGFVSIILEIDERIKGQKDKFVYILSEVAQHAEVGKPYLEKGHSEFVSCNSMIIAKMIGMNDREVDDVKIAGLLHDVGKVMIPQRFFESENFCEVEEVKKHVIYSSEMVANVQGMEEVAECILYHHEHWDGSGFPRGISGEEIPICSRIIFIVNDFDFMIRKKTKGETKSVKEALDYISKNKGKRYDPYVADVALSYFERMYLN